MVIMMTMECPCPIVKPLTKLIINDVKESLYSIDDDDE